MASKATIALGLASVAGIVSADLRPVPGPAVPGKWHVRLDPAITNEDQIDPALRAKLSDVFVSVFGAELTTTDMALVNEVVAHKQVFYVQQGMVLDSSTFSGWGPNPAIQDKFTEYDVASPDSWGIKRLAGLPLKGTQGYQGGNGDGEGVDVYVVSTGVAADHPQVQGRVKNFYTDPSLSPTFEGAIGTMLAGITAGTKGVAAKATIQSVKIADSAGKSDTIKLMRAAHQIITKRDPTRPAVVVFPWSGPSAGALANTARFLAATEGIFMVAPGAYSSGAGAACTVPPGSQQQFASFLTVGAINPQDQAAILNGNLFSSFGPCMDVMAPGWNVRAPNPFNTTTDNYYVGANAAVAHVAGVAALVKGKFPSATNAQVRKAILSMSEEKVTFDPTIPDLTPRRIARLNFDATTLCKSTNPTITDDFCRQVECNVAYGAMCELNAKSAPERVCKSVVSHVPDGWCQSVGCDSAYFNMCQWQCSA